VGNWVSTFLESNPELASLEVHRRERRALHLRQGREVVALCLGAPVHFWNPDEHDWAPIDTTLQPDPRSADYFAPASPVRLTPDGVVRVTGRGYAQHTRRVGLFNPKTPKFLDTQTLPAGSGCFKDDRLVRGHSSSFVSTIVTPTGLREELTIYDCPIGETGDWLAMETVISGQQLPDGPLGRYWVGSFEYPAPVVRDAAGHFTSGERYALSVGGEQIIYTGVSLEWLAGAAYPVVIDPDFTSDSATDGYIRGYSSGSFSTARSSSYDHDLTGTVMQVGINANSGWYVYRSMLKFDTSSIPDAATINGVTMTMVDSRKFVVSGGRDFDVQIVKYDWSASDPVAAGNRETVYDGILAATLDAVWKNTSAMTDNNAYQSAALSTSWVSKTGWTYYGLLGSYDKSNSSPATGQQEWLQITAANSASGKPFLSVAYTAAQQFTQGVAGALGWARAASRGVSTTLASAGLNTAGSVKRLDGHLVFRNLFSNGTVNKLSARVASGALGTAGAAKRNVSTHLASAGLNAAGAVQRLTAAAKSGAIGLAGVLEQILTHQEAFQQALSGALGSSGAMAHTATWLRSLIADLGSSGDLGRLASLKRALSGDLSGTSSLTTLRAILKSLTRALDSSGEVVRDIRRSVSGALDTSGSLAQRLTFLRDLVGSLASSGVMLRRLSRSLAGAVGSSGTVVNMKVLLRAVSGALGTASVIARQPGKVLDAGLTAARGLKRATSKFATGELGSSGAISRQARKLLTAALGLTGVTAELFGKMLAGALGVARDLRRQTAKPLAAVLSSSRQQVKQLKRDLAGSLTATGAVALTQAIFVVLAGSLALASEMLRQSRKALGGTLIGPGDVSRQLDRSLAGEISGFGAIQRRTARSLARALDPLGELLYLRGKHLTGELGMSKTFTRGVNITLAGVLTFIGKLIKQRTAVVLQVPLTLAPRQLGLTLTSRRLALTLPERT
jgi:hypothetical protein